MTAFMDFWIFVSNHFFLILYDNMRYLNAIVRLKSVKMIMNV